MSVHEVPNFDNPPCASTDPEIFFASELKGSSVVRDYAYARKICSTCPYREPCAEYGLHNRVMGVWGGCLSNSANFYAKLVTSHRNLWSWVLYSFPKQHLKVNKR